VRGDREPPGDRGRRAPRRRSPARVHADELASRPRRPRDPGRGRRPPRARRPAPAARPPPADHRGAGRGRPGSRRRLRPVDDQIVELFVTINAKHTKLNPSHLISLAGRRLYPDKELAASHDIIRALNEHGDSPLHNEIKLFGVGRGRVAQAPLAEELKGIFTALDALGGRQSDRFRDSAQRFFLNYFKQIAAVFPRAWVGRKYSIKTGVALRAFLRVVPDVLKAIRDAGGDALDAHAIRQAIKPWGLLVGDARFETEGEWRQKQAGGTRGTVEMLARELRAALRG
jgi:hypothetical protein